MNPAIKLAFPVFLFGGCGILFYGIGRYACKKPTPFCFWAGTEIPADRVPDLPGYNRTCGKMMKAYSAAYFFCVPFGAIGMWHEWAMFVVLGLLVFAGTVGLFLLIRYYKRLEKAYIVR